MCRLIRLALEPGGYQIVAEHDGKAGLEAIRARRPDLVLLDIKMPGLNGYQVLAALQSDDEAALRDTPVIVLTSMTDGDRADDEEWARRLGVAAFVSKPFDPERISELVNRMLGGSQAAR